MTFSAAGTWTNNLVPPTGGTWSTVAGMLTVEIDGDVVTFDYSVEAGVLTLAQPEGATTVFTSSQKL